VYELIEPSSLAELEAKFEWSTLRIYDINASRRNHGILLGTIGWTRSLAVGSSQGIAPPRLPQELNCTLGGCGNDLDDETVGKFYAAADVVAVDIANDHTLADEAESEWAREPPRKRNGLAIRARP
jgi:hypothetical protein